jgi:hypothetical protein
MSFDHVPCDLDLMIPARQLYTATLDNTGNNNTMCKTIQDIHARRGLPEWNSSELQLQ